uniref:Putative salivary secreted serine protease inhibitor n=1 Tax=Anopheles marajoara TaxID=58244 RepID=A0A2M4C501_9DIPT
MRAFFALLVLAIFAILGSVQSQAAQGQGSRACGKEESFHRCGSGCERTCLNQKKWSEECDKPCIDGCFCNEGYLRDATGECIRSWLCRKD